MTTDPPANQTKKQRHMAEAVGVSTQQWGKYERFENRMSSGALETACRFLGIPLDDAGADPGPTGFSDPAAARYDPDGRSTEAELAPALADLAGAIAVVQAILLRAGSREGS